MSLREKIAELEHNQWIHWTTYFLGNLTEKNESRWRSQCLTKYENLSETEKDADRVWADKVLALIDSE